MPDQSLSNEPVSGKTDQQVGNPADTSANSPQQATPESQESNVTRASEGQKLQADVTINQDPRVGSAGSASPQAAGSPEPASDEYDDEDKWGYRELQQEAKKRDLDASGKREEIVARLRGGGGQTDTPRGDVGDQSPEGGSIGFHQSERGRQHAEILQGLSNDRRAQQLAAVKERSERNAS